MFGSAIRLSEVTNCWSIMNTRFVITLLSPLRRECCCQTRRSGGEAVGLYLGSPDRFLVVFLSCRTSSDRCILSRFIPEGMNCVDEGARGVHVTEVTSKVVPLLN
jgi:hypothetical protein